LDAIIIYKMKWIRAKEQTGTWTTEEHDRFLEALDKYGKNWRAIERVVGTRTASQARSHAQKHFLKNDRANSSSSGLTPSMLPTMAKVVRDIGVQYGEGVKFRQIPFTTDQLPLLPLLPQLPLDSFPYYP
jgi:SHAQKYF class myb-like DNA-binding protein